MGEPWSFDRHLVVFQRYDLSTPIEDLNFSKVAFWVQIHNLPYSLLTTEVAVHLGESLGEVNVPNDPTEMKGGNLMRVRVTIDIAEPLCRGRRVDFDDDNEGWVSFQYERLPNLCYWCGHLTHDDKECALWLRSKGTLSVQDQQFGLWIRASQFNPAKKSIVEVQGYETMPGASRMRGGQVGRDRLDTAPVSVSIGNMESSNVSGESGKSLAHQSKMKFAATL